MSKDASALLRIISLVFAGFGVLGILWYGGARGEVSPQALQRLVASAGLLLAAIWLLLVSRF